MEILDAVIKSIGFIQVACPWDCAVVVVNKEGIIRAIKIPNSLPMPPEIRVGNSIDPRAVEYTCINAKKSIVLEHDAGARMSLIPIFETDGNISGVVNIIIPLDKQKTLTVAVQSIVDITKTLNQGFDELGGSALQLVENLTSIKNGEECVFAKINKTDEILKFVSNIAANSNLLGLNAAIEAARAGEHGRGFSVVADEIRKMAVNSENSVTQIKELLLDIRHKSLEVAKTIENTSELSEHQAAATEKIVATIQSLSLTADEVGRVAQSL